MWAIQRAGAGSVGTQFGRFIQPVWAQIFYENSPNDCDTADAQD